MTVSQQGTPRSGVATLCQTLPTAITICTAILCQIAGIPFGKGQSRLDINIFSVKSTTWLTFPPRLEVMVAMWKKSCCQYTLSHEDRGLQEEAQSDLRCNAIQLHHLLSSTYKHALFLQPIS